jgi:hypothetical protein
MGDRESRESRELAERVFANPELRSRFEAMAQESTTRTPVPDDFAWLSQIRPGDRVRCRDAYGRWHEATAESGPRVDHPNTLPNARNAVTVSVSGIWDHPVNWPVEDVELVEVSDGGS